MCDVVKVDDCDLCNQCGGPSNTCGPLNNVKIEGCSGAERVAVTEKGEKKCIEGACKVVKVEDCTECNKCMTGAFVFDPLSPMQEVCSICGEKCTEQPDNTGLCSGNSCDSSEVCTLGERDELDMCEPACTCTDSSECSTGEDCIEGSCIHSGDCNKGKDTLCDGLWEAIRNQEETCEVLS